jgi:hypothetical protein
VGGPGHLRAGPSDTIDTKKHEMTDSKSSNKLLSIYLNDHLAGSMIGVGLARRQFSTKEDMKCPS